MLVVADILRGQRRSPGQRDKYGDQAPGGAADHADAGQKPVQPVLKVGAVDHKDHRQCHQRHIERAQIPLHIKERHDHAAADHGVLIAIPGEGQRDHDLRHDLLPPDQAQIALFHDLDVVVHKAHQHGQQRNADQRQRKVPLAVPVAGQHSRRQTGGQHEHQAAHGGGALLGLVGLGTQLVHRLTEFELAQHGDHPRPQHQHARQRKDQRQNQL